MTDHAPPAGRQQQLLAKVDVLEQLPPEEVAHLASRSASVRLGGGGSFNIVGGPALIVAGLAFIPTPGPSYIIIVIGVWMLAAEFLPLARFFDRLEARLRKVGRWIKMCWKTLPASVRVLVVFVCAAALGYGIYCLVSGG